MILILLFIIFVSANGIYDGITFEKVSRNIDLTSQLSKQEMNITISNSGSKATSDFYLAFDAQLAEHLSLLEIRDVNEISLSNEKANTHSNKGRSFILYRVSLPTSLSSGSSIDVRVEAIFTHTMKPFPAKITQYEKQLVKYYDNHFVSSPYKIQSQTTKVKLASSHIESKSEQNPTNVKGDTITYGQYNDIAPYEFSQMTLHFENNAPFLTITSLVREIEISHYGNVAIEDTYQMEHDGAILKGTFSRYDYQRSQGFAPAHIPSFREILPDEASDIYYRDEIGNISTSHVSISERGLTLDLIPRFPLFGGWKFGFYMGYNLPIQNYIFVDNQHSGVYMLNIPFVPTFDNAVIDEITIRVIMPEGASNFQSFTSFPVDRKGEDRHYTYLDTSGRPVLVLSKKNVVSDFDKPLQVTYHFSTLSMLQEPFLLIIAFFSFFLFIMIYVRLEFHIGPAKQRRPNADKIEVILLKVKDVFDQRGEEHQKLDNTLNKSTGKIGEYNMERNKVDTNLNRLKSSYNKLVIEMEELDSELTKKLKDLERKEDERSNNQFKLHDIELQIRSGKGVKNESLKADTEKAYIRSEEEVTSMLNDIVGDL